MVSNLLNELQHLQSTSVTSSVAPHLNKLSNARKRISSAAEDLSNIQERLHRISHQLALTPTGALKGDPPRLMRTYNPRLSPVPIPGSSALHPSPSDMTGHAPSLNAQQPAGLSPLSSSDFSVPQDMTGHSAPVVDVTHHQQGLSPIGSVESVVAEEVTGHDNRTSISDDAEVDPPPQ
mmetsp:Transcript_44908/g.73180  ORF Transcript_44908/g.73180 Transcript_44908/m.73180 type:complete len:178 (+) Transcript_44908:172-705(+)